MLSAIDRSTDTKQERGMWSMLTAGVMLSWRPKVGEVELTWLGISVLVRQRKVSSLAALRWEVKSNASATLRSIYVDEVKK